MCGYKAIGGEKLYAGQVLGNSESSIKGQGKESEREREKKKKKLTC